MLTSLKKKILSGFLLITIICIISFTSVAVLETRKIATNQMKNDGITLSTMLEKHLSGYKITDTDEMSKELKEIKKESSERLVYVAICDTKFKIISQDDDSMTGQNIQDTYSSEQAMKQKKAVGAIITRNNGEKVYNVSTPFYDNGEVVGAVNIGISLGEMNKLIKEGFLEILIIALIILGISMVIAIIISRGISGPIKTIVDKMHKVSQGDFTVEFNAKGKDEIAKLMNSLDSTIKIIRETIEKIQNAAVNIDGVSENLTSASEETAASGTEVSNAISEVAQGAFQQAQQIYEATEALERFGQVLDKINNKVIAVADSSENIKKSANSGSIKIEELSKSIDNIKDAFKSASYRINSLNSSVTEISEITNLINKVAGQTNLLALNAAIEAARAGEAGKGFSVVAEEIRKLAEQVLQSSKDINSLIETVINNTKQVSETTNVVSEKMHVQMEAIGGTVESFKDILGEVERVFPQIEEVSERLSVSIGEKDKILKNVETISGISQELSASSEEISSAVEQQSASVEEVAASAQSLTELADRLANGVEKLKV